MTTLSGILGNAVTGLQTAQTGLSVVSDNVSNVDTPGYVRKVAEQTSLTAAAQGAGVKITDIRRLVDQYLQAASLNGNAQSSSAGAVADTLDQAQALFGDPSDDGSLFANLDSVFSAFSALSANPTSAGEAQAVAQTSQFFSQATSIASSLGALSGQADSKIATDVGTVNQLLGQIQTLNVAISRASGSGGDVTGSQDQQSQLIDQLSSLIGVKVTGDPQGGVVVRTIDGTLLAGQGGSASLSYNPSGSTGQLSITNATGVTQPFGSRAASGEIQGLLSLRNVELPAISTQLSNLTSSVADTLNGIHNAYSAVPPPTTLTGRNTGLDLPTAVSGFTGKTTIALVNPSTNALDQRVDIDFDAGTISVNGGAANAFRPATFLSTLNSALGPGGSASFANGALSLSGGADGVAIQDDATTPATKAGRGFSAFFGLNDLVSSSVVGPPATGLKATDPSGFPAGQSITFRLTDASGATLQDVTATTPAGGSVADLLTALNASSGGVGLYGSFSLAGDGTLSFNANANSGVSLAVESDKTARGANGPSVSQLFGLGNAVAAARGASFSVRSDIASSPTTLAIAKLDLSQPAGSPVLASGDASGADALGQAGLTVLNAGSSAAGTLSNLAASIASAIANRASSAESAKTQAAAVASDASSRRSSSEGVNIDDELVQLTTYQQAYNASARVIQAASDLFTTLLNTVN